MYMPDYTLSEPFKTKYTSRFAVSTRFVPFLLCSQARNKALLFTHSTVLAVNDHNTHRLLAGSIVLCS